jgi:DNA (cytosine-5)-methyltransferase 1
MPSFQAQPGLRVVSLFAGAGGLDIAFCETGHVSELFSTDSHPVFLQTVINNLPKHFPKVRHSHLVADARTLTGDEILKHISAPVDLVIGGPPCDNFTCFGKRQGLDGSKGPLIFEFARIISELRPRCFLFENVPNLQRQFKDALRDLINYFEQAGYDVSNSCLLSAPEYGSPTKRKRLFIVGFKEQSTAQYYKFPLSTHVEKKEDQFSEIQPLKNFVNVGIALGDLPDVGSGDGNIFNHTGRSHKPATIEHMKTVPQGIAVSKSFRYRAPWDGLCRSLTAGVDHSTKSYLHPIYHREMSVREYARLHGFQDTWVFFGNHHNGIKQVANAVPIQLGSAVAHSICKTIAFDYPSESQFVKPE